MLDSTCMKLSCTNQEVTKRQGWRRMSGPQRAPHAIMKSALSIQGVLPKHQGALCGRCAMLTFTLRAACPSPHVLVLVSKGKGQRDASTGYPVQWMSRQHRGASTRSQPPGRLRVGVTKGGYAVQTHWCLTQKVLRAVDRTAAGWRGSHPRRHPVRHLGRPIGEQAGVGRAQAGRRVGQRRRMEQAELRELADAEEEDRKHGQAECGREPQPVLAEPGRCEEMEDRLACRPWPPTVAILSRNIIIAAA